MEIMFFQNNGTLLYLLPWDNKFEPWIPVFPEFEEGKLALRGHIYPQGVAKGLMSPERPISSLKNHGK